MKKDIIPSFSALVSEEVFLADNDLRGLQHIYVQANNMEIFHYAKTSGGYSLHSLGSVKGLPKKIESIPSKLTQTFSHLPGGRIPLWLLSQILSFFMEYALKGSDEAVAHILWNTLTNEYEVGVPTQKVSSAAANFTYDDIKPHHIIVVDIHSHNYMSSFWSGTDDKDDAKGVWISGVFGNVGTNPSCNWRYSYLGKFQETNHDEIFDLPFSEVNLMAAYPTEWNDRVTVRPPVPIGRGFSLGQFNRGAYADEDFYYDWSPGVGSKVPVYKDGYWVIEEEDEFGIDAEVDDVDYSRQRVVNIDRLNEDAIYDLASDSIADIGDLSDLLANRIFRRSLSEVSSNKDLKSIDSLISSLYSVRALIVNTHQSKIQERFRRELEMNKPIAKADDGYKKK